MRKIGMPAGIFVMLLLLIVSPLCVGCAQKPAPEPSPVANPCTLPEGNRLEQVIEGAKQSLRSRECITHFDAYFERLLAVGEMDRNPKNGPLIREFITWCIQEGVLTERSGRQYFGAYFSPVFVCLEQKHTYESFNNCSQCPKLKEITHEIDMELAKKERGLLKITGETAKYDKAKRDKDDFLVILTATCMACEEKD